MVAGYNPIVVDRLAGLVDRLVDLVVRQNGSRPTRLSFGSAELTDGDVDTGAGRATDDILSPLRRRLAVQGVGDSDARAGRDNQGVTRFAEPA